MILSMTGFAAVAAELPGVSLAVELRSVNHRYLDLQLRLPDELRAEDDQIKKLPLRVGDSGMISLGQVVAFTTIKTVEPIQRESGQRRAALMVNLKTRDIEGYVRAAEQSLREQVKLPDHEISRLTRPRGRAIYLAHRHHRDTGHPQGSA